MDVEGKGPLDGLKGPGGEDWWDDGGKVEGDPQGEFDVEGMDEEKRAKRARRMATLRKIVRDAKGAPAGVAARKALLDMQKGGKGALPDKFSRGVTRPSSKRLEQFVKTYDKRHDLFVEWFDVLAEDWAEEAVRAGVLAGFQETQAPRLLKMTRVLSALKYKEEYGTSPVGGRRAARMSWWMHVMRTPTEDMSVRLRASELAGRSDGDFKEVRELSGTVDHNMKVASQMDVRSLQVLLTEGSVGSDGGNKEASCTDGKKLPSKT